MKLQYRQGNSNLVSHNLICADELIGAKLNSCLNMDVLMVRLVFIFISLIAAGGLIAQQSFRRSELLSAIFEEQASQKIDAVKKLPVLQKEFERAIQPAQKGLYALSLGVNYYYQENWITSLQYLSAAQQLIADDQPIKPIVYKYIARNYLELGNHELALDLAEKLEKSARSKSEKKQAFEIKIKSLHAAQNSEKVIATYHAFKNQIAPRTMSHSLLKIVALNFWKRDAWDSEIDVLEALVDQYPLSPESVWAFQKLVDYSCSTDAKRRYSFSTKLLQRLTINRSIELGLEEFLVAQTLNPLRTGKGEPKKLNTIERANLLLDLYLPRAVDAFRKDLEMLAENGLPDERHKASFTLARLDFDLRRFGDAAKKFENFVINFPEGGLRLKALEGLAASQFGSGAYGSARATYAQLNILKPGQYGWDHFWSSYMANDFNGALALLDRKNYVKPKDPNEPLVLSYWRAKIFEKTGQNNSADAEYRNILQQDAGSFYGLLTIASHPNYWSEYSAHIQTTTPNESEHFQKTDTTSQDQSIANQPISSDGDFSTNKTLNLIRDLTSAGLTQDAIEQFESVSASDLKTANDLTSVQELAYKLSDYRAYRRVIVDSAAEFRSYPKNLTQMLEHQKTYSKTWKAIFPNAYEDIVERVTKILSVDKLLVLSLMRTESRYDRYARSWVGALGLMQIMPKTGIRISRLVDNANFVLTDLYDYNINIGYGSFYIRRLLDAYGSNPFIAVAAYNAGPHATNRWVEVCGGCSSDEFVESITYRETRRYVKEVMKYYGIYSNIYRSTQALEKIPQVPKLLTKNEDLF